MNRIRIFAASVSVVVIAAGVTSTVAGSAAASPAPTYRCSDGSSPTAGQNGLAFCVTATAPHLDRSARPAALGTSSALAANPANQGKVRFDQTPADQLIGHPHRASVTPSLTKSNFPPSCEQDVQYVSLVEDCIIASDFVSITQDGKEVGFFNFNLWEHSYGDITSSNYTTEYLLERRPQTDYGKFTSGWTASVKYTCTCPSWVKPTTDFGTQRFDETTASPYGTARITTTPTSGQVGFITPTAELTLTQAEIGSHVQKHSQEPWRCDRAIPGNNNTAGCRVPYYPPLKTYYLYGQWPEFADHVRQAQNSGLIGRPKADGNGHPVDQLRRQDGDTDARRNIACKSSYVRPAGKSCDEYPFASTSQGAGSSQAAGGPRTFPGCQIPSVPSATGSSGYSVCMINATQNRDAGIDLNNFYIRTRTINYDPFFVLIVATE